jgi:hypothetical protein
LIVMPNQTDMRSQYYFPITDDDEWAELKEEIICFKYLNANENAQINFRQLTKSLNTLAHSHKVCVWPAIDEDVRFFRSVSEIFYDNAYFINRKSPLCDLEHADRECLDALIYNPNINLKENIEIVICPRNTLLKEIGSICETDYQSVKKVPYLRLQIGTWAKNYKDRRRYIYEKLSR